MSSEWEITYTTEQIRFPNFKRLLEPEWYKDIVTKTFVRLKSVKIMKFKSESESGGGGGGVCVCVCARVVAFATYKNV